MSSEIIHFIKFLLAHDENKFTYNIHNVLKYCKHFFLDTFKVKTYNLKKLIIKNKILLRKT